MKPNKTDPILTHGQHSHLVIQLSPWHSLLPGPRQAGWKVGEGQEKAGSSEDLPSRHIASQKQGEGGAGLKCSPLAGDCHPQLAPRGGQQAPSSLTKHHRRPLLEPSIKVSCCHGKLSSTQTQVSDSLTVPDDRYGKICS